MTTFEKELRKLFDHDAIFFDTRLSEELATEKSVIVSASVQNLSPWDMPIITKHSKYRLSTGTKV